MKFGVRTIKEAQLEQMIKFESNKDIDEPRSVAYIKAMIKSLNEELYGTEPQDLRKIRDANTLVVKELMKLDFNGTQAWVLAMLIENKEMVIHEFASRVEVHRSMIYRFLNGFVKDGLIVKLNNTVAAYAILDLDVFFDQLLVTKKADLIRYMKVVNNIRDVA